MHLNSHKYYLLRINYYKTSVQGYDDTHSQHVFCYSSTGQAWFDNNKIPLFVCFKNLFFLELLDFVMFQCNLTKINKIVKLILSKS